jgi:hypothetical protein
MKSIRRVLLATSIFAVACSGSATEVSEKAEVDRTILEEEGITVVVSGSLANTDVPLANPVPTSVSDEEFEAEMREAISFVIVSVSTGASADLSDATVVEGEPAAPGEVNWSFNEARDAVTVQFYNESASGMSLTAGGDYTAQLSIASNPYISMLPAVGFDLTVEPAAP